MDQPPNPGNPIPRGLEVLIKKAAVDVESDRPEDKSTPEPKPKFEGTWGHDAKRPPQKEQLQSESQDK